LTDTGDSKGWDVPTSVRFNGSKDLDEGVSSMLLSKFKTKNAEIEVDASVTNWDFLVGVRG
jgi:hypothetical protein